MKYLERYNINHHFTSALNASNYYLPGIQNKYSARPINKHHPNLLPRIPTLPQTPPLCVTKSSKLLFIAICSFTQNSKMLLLMVCEEMGDPPVATTVVVFFKLSLLFSLKLWGEGTPPAKSENDGIFLPQGLKKIMQMSVTFSKTVCLLFQFEAESLKHNSR